MQVKPKSKVKSKADQYDSKLLPKSGKQTPADFMPKSYDKRFKPVKGGGVNVNGPSIGPREYDPKGMSKNGSKLKKAKNGETVERGMTSEVKVRPTFKANVKNDMKRAMSTDSTDYQNTPAKTTAGKVLRGANKVASTVARGVMAPVAAAASVAGNAIKSASNAIRARKEEKGYKKNGGKVAPKMMMKKMSKKK
jgi:hypothetical protein